MGLYNYSLITDRMAAFDTGNTIKGVVE